MLFFFTTSTNVIFGLSLFESI